jgi:predicted O-linked N-acetylglucosamine transferase (SPINDLY family)
MEYCELFMVSELSLNTFVTPPLTIAQTLQLAEQSYRAGQLPQAVVLYRQVLQVQPNQSEALHALGVIAAQSKHYEEAMTLIKQAILSNSAVPTFHNSLGNVFWLQKQLDEALECYQRALSLNPNLVEIYNNVGMIFGEQGKFAEAMACFQRVLAVHPKEVNALYNLGLAFSKQGRLTEAEACYQQVLTLNPNYVEAYSNLGKVCKDRGKIAEAIQYYRTALHLQPTYVEAYNNLLYTFNFSPDYDLAMMFAEHQQFNQRYALPLASVIKPPRNHRDSQRRLKLGYISPDFRKHSLTYFVEPVLSHHDHDQFEVFCYYNNLKVDEVTRRLQQYADHWITCAGWSDEVLAERIRQDQIDILVDLMGHTANNRLLVFARKPAPIQVFNTIGYSNTTGLTAMDYRITDGYIDPEGVAEEFSSETLVKMPVSYYCYRPNDDSPPVNDLPAIQNGYLTFGAFNSYAKLTQPTLALWTTVLQAVSGSKLRVMTRELNDPVLRQELYDRFTLFGISPERLIMGSAPSTEETLKAYHQIDIGLDPFPFCGATTTCQALWMGVPVITLVGKTPAARAGLSILSALGLTEVIAYTSQDYLNIAIRLAGEIEYLQRLRATMRDRMTASPLMDAVGFTRHLESAYRAMWEKWCKHQ